MKTTKRSSLSGRTTLAAVCLLSFATIAGVLLLHPSAKAQGELPPASMTRFGPAIIGPSDTPDPTQILIGLLLPAVQKVRSSARVQVLNDDTNLSLPAVQGEIGTSTYFLVYLTSDRATNTDYLNLRNLRTGDHKKAPTRFVNATIRIVPTVDEAGQKVMPLSSSATLQSRRTVKMGDGSVIPFPLEYALPPQQ